MMIHNADVKRRIIEISYKYKLSHIASCLTAVDIIEQIYQERQQHEPFILSSGHAGLALYVVLEKHYHIDADYLFTKHGVHPNRDMANQIWCSSGSLGHGLPIAVGMALADRDRNVYCLISDGECSEGSIYEAMRIRYEQQLTNLKVYLNANSWGAYGALDSILIGSSLSCYTAENLSLEFCATDKLVSQWPDWLQGQAGHYATIDSEQKIQQLLQLLY